jgi:hypothetical protein
MTGSIKKKKRSVPSWCSSHSPVLLIREEEAIHQAALISGKVLIATCQSLGDNGTMGQLWEMFP